ncbi:hypothetical protein EVAR_11583_1 [Eumeta japonica]|uniref:Uncharacterized protein n=1 Tax=Eumeta variegata TaxID=151549 RepID=A0A4C1X584_EUMVA|nr:hypothetical protein EVAR_11583_1 [Eumeta japonica]
MASTLSVTARPERERQKILFPDLIPPGVLALPALKDLLLGLSWKMLPYRERLKEYLKGQRLEDDKAVSAAAQEFLGAQDEEF